MKYTRKVILLCIPTLVLLLVSAEELCARAGFESRTEMIQSVDPYRAIVCAVAALVVGLLSFLWRHRKMNNGN